MKIRQVSALQELTYSPGGGVITIPRGVCLSNIGFSLVPSCSKMLCMQRLESFGMFLLLRCVLWSGPMTEKIGSLSQRGEVKAEHLKHIIAPFGPWLTPVTLYLQRDSSGNGLPPSARRLSVYWGWLCPAWREQKAMHRTSFPLCKDITCRAEWVHSICCAEIGQTKLDGSRLILESNTYYVTLPKWFDLCNYQLPWCVVSQSDGHVVGVW